MEDLLKFLEANYKSIIGACIGFVVGLFVVLIGIQKTFILFCFVVCGYFATKMDIKKIIIEKLKKEKDF